MSMSDSLTADEKRRMLRERRQAKMNSKGTQRLNHILLSGSSVKETVSPLEKKPETPSFETKTIAVPAVTFNDDDDPEDIDISQHSHASSSPSPFPHSTTASSMPPNEELDEMLSKMFGNPQAGSSNPFGASLGADGEDPFATMMKMFGGDGGLPGAGASPASPPPTSYHTQLQAYHVYKQQKIKNMFLVVRYVVTFVNFVYHYRGADSLQLASYDFIRSGWASGASSFFASFITCEVALLAAYFVIMLKKKYIANENHIILKIVSFASLVLPKLNLFRPLIVTMLSYWEMFGIFLGDLALVTLLFGLVSFRGN